MNKSQKTLSPPLTDNQWISKGAFGRRAKQINTPIPCLGFFLALGMKPILQDIHRSNNTRTHTRHSHSNSFVCFETFKWIPTKIGCPFSRHFLRSDFAVAKGTNPKNLNFKISRNVKSSNLVCGTCQNLSPLNMHKRRGTCWCWHKWLIYFS